MEESDFDPKIIEEAETYSHVILGAMGYTWNIPLSEMEKTQEKDVEFIKAQLIFFLVKCRKIDKINSNKHHDVEKYYVDDDEDIGD